MRLHATGFTGCGKTPIRAVSYQGTTSVVPLSRLFLSSLAGFSPRGICSSDFFSSLFSRGVPRAEAHFLAQLSARLTIGIPEVVPLWEN
jgi:hypothetical protein